MPYNDHDFFIFARERVQFRRKQTSEREMFNEKQRMEMEEFQKEAQIRQVCPSIFFFALVFVFFLRLFIDFISISCCVLISHLC